VQYPGATYRVIKRGGRCEDIFHEGKDPGMCSAGGGLRRVGIIRATPPESMEHSGQIPRVFDRPATFFHP
jgi:hypothetical protein